MSDEPEVITYQFLQKRGISRRDLERFKDLFPFGAPRTEETVKTLTEKFDLAAIGHLFLDEDNRKQYLESKKGLAAEEKRLLYAATTKFHKVRDSASVAYHKEVAPALKALNDAKSQLEKTQRKAARAFNKEVGPAERAYNEAFTTQNKVERAEASRVFKGLFLKAPQ